MAMYYTIWLTLTKTLSLSPLYSELSASIEMCASNGILLTAGLMLSSHFLVWLIQPIALDISDVSLNTISTMLLKYVNIKAYFLLYFITKLLLGNFTDVKSQQNNSDLNYSKCGRLYFCKWLKGMLIRSGSSSRRICEYVIVSGPVDWKIHIDVEESRASAGCKQARCDRFYLSFPERYMGPPTILH